MQVDETLVDLHLVAVERGGTVTARRLAGRVREQLRRHAHWALDLEVLVLGALQQVRAHCATARALSARARSQTQDAHTLLQIADVGARQRDADALEANLLGLERSGLAGEKAAKKNNTRRHRRARVSDAAAKAAVARTFLAGKAAAAAAGATATTTAAAAAAAAAGAAGAGVVATCGVDVASGTMSAANDVADSGCASKTANRNALRTRACVRA